MSLLARVLGILLLAVPAAFAVVFVLLLIAAVLACWPGAALLTWAAERDFAALLRRIRRAHADA